MSSHRAAFEYFKSLYTASNSATGLNNALSPSHLFGGFIRRGEQNNTIQPPWIEFEIASEREVDAFVSGSLGERIDMVVRLHLFTKKDQVYSSLSGSQNTILTVVRSVFHNVKPSYSSALAWDINKIYRVSGVQAPDDGNHAHHVETYLTRLNRSNVP